MNEWYFTFGLGMYLYKGRVLTDDLNANAVKGLFLGGRYVRATGDEIDARERMTLIFGAGNWCGPYTPERFKLIQGRRASPLRELAL